MCKSFNSVCKCQCGWSAQALRILAVTLSGPAAFLTSTLCRMDLTWGWSSWMALTFPGRTRCVSAAICRSSWWLCSCPCSRSESLSPATCFTRCCWRAPLCAASSCVWTHWCFYSDFIVLARRPAGPRLKCRFLCPGRLLWPSHWIWLFTQIPLLQTHRIRGSFILQHTGQNDRFLCMFWNHLSCQYSHCIL